MNSIAPISEVPKNPWYLVYTKPRQEIVASFNLERQGFRTYLPKVEVQRRREKRVCTQIEPFFPRYLFLQLDRTTGNWSAIRCTRGVSSLIGFGGEPSVVHGSLIDALVNNEDANQRQIVKRAEWNRGDCVEIENGPFAGYSCIFSEHRSSHRVLVLLDVIGKKTAVEVDLNDLQIPDFA